MARTPVFNALFRVSFEIVARSKKDWLAIFLSSDKKRPTAKIIL